jgi:hypothetical protein
MRGSNRISLTTLAGAVAIAGCGSAGVTPPPTVAEIAQQPAKPPPRWRVKLDHAHGFSIAVPPGWAVVDNGGAVLFRSPDHLVAVSLSVDRTPAAFAGPPAEFARQTLAALPGYESPLRPGPPRRITGTPLKAIAVGSSGVASAGGVRQNVEVAVLRRDGLVNYTAVTAANSKATPAVDSAQANRILKTIRDLPIA